MEEDDELSLPDPFPQIEGGGDERPFLDLNENVSVLLLGILLLCKRRICLYAFLCSFNYFTGFMMVSSNLLIQSRRSIM